MASLSGSSLRKHEHRQSMKDDWNSGTKNIVRVYTIRNLDLKIDTILKKKHTLEPPSTTIKQGGQTSKIEHTLVFNCCYYQIGGGMGN
jgi:hypothetical protein